jgi:hypothetical protein
MLQRKGKAYEKYQREVPSAFIPLPPALQRCVCGLFGARR